MRRYCLATTEAPDPVAAISAIKLAQLQPRDGIQNEPHEVPFRHPIPHIRRQQERLLTITTNEVLSHPGMVLLKPTGRHSNYATASHERGSLASASPELWIDREATACG